MDEYAPDVMAIARMLRTVQDRRQSLGCLQEKAGKSLPD